MRLLALGLKIDPIGEPPIQQFGDLLRTPSASPLRVANKVGAGASITV